MYETFHSVRQKRNHVIKKSSFWLKGLTFRAFCARKLRLRRYLWAKIIKLFSYCEREIKIFPLKYFSHKSERGKQELNGGNNFLLHFFTQWRAGASKFPVKIFFPKMKGEKRIYTGNFYGKLLGTSSFENKKVKILCSVREWSIAQPNRPQ